MFIPTYKEDSLTVLIGTVGFGQISVGSTNLHDLDFRTLPGHITPVQFSPSDVGKIIMVLGAGASGSNLVCKIAAYVSTTQVTLDTPASTAAINGTANVVVFRPVKVKEGSISATDSITSRGQCQFTVQTTAANVCPVEGQPYLLTSTDPDVGTDTYGAFIGGEIDKVTTPNQPGATGYYESECECVGYEAICSRRLMRGKEYSAQTMAQVVADIVATGLQAEFVDVDCPTGPTVDLITVSDLSYVSDALDQLLQGLSDPTTGYFWRATPYRKIKVGQALAVTSPWHISDADITDKNVLVSVSQARSRDKLSNQVYVKDSLTMQDPATVFTFKNPANRPFGGVALPDTPPFAPAVTVNGISQVVETVDPADSDKWVLTNYAVAKWSWVKGTTGLRPTPPAAIPVGGTLVATYRKSYDSLSLRTFDDGLSGFGVQARSAIEGGSGLHESVVSIDNPMTQAVLDTKAANLARQLGIVPSEVTVETYRGGLKAGQALFIRLTDLNVVNTYLVAESSMTTADGYVKWSVRAVYGSAMGDYITALASAFSGSLPIGVGGVPVGSPLPNPDLFLQFAGTSGMRGVAYVANLLAAGGNPGYTYSVSSGTMPNGLTLDSATGVITGVPTLAGSFTVIFQVTDSLAQIALATGTINISVADISGATVTAVSAEEIPGSVYQELAGGLHMVVRISPTVSSQSFPVQLRYWINFADGRGYVLLGDRYAGVPSPVEEFGGQTQSTGLTIPGTIWVPTNPDLIHWSAAVEANSTSEQPTRSAAFVAFDVEAASPVPIDDLQNIHFVLNEDGLPIDYVYASPGSWYWTWRMEATQPAVGSSPSVRNDPYFKSSFFTTQKGWKAVSAVTVTGGVDVAKTGGEPFIAEDAGRDIYFGTVKRTITVFTDASHVTIDSPVSNGTGITCATWRPAPDHEGRDEDPSGTYRGIKFTDGSAPSQDGETVVRVGGDTWDVPHSDNTDGSANPYLEYWIRAYGVSRRADNERGGAETVTIQTWPDGNDYGSILPVEPAPGLDLRKSRSNTMGSLLGGGDGTPPHVKIAGPMYEDISGNLNLRIANDFVVTSVAGLLTLSQHIVDLAKSVNFDLGQFNVVAGALVIQALAVNKLVAGDALFAGDATFARVGGGKVTINSAGIAIEDNNTTPTAKAAVGATGVTLTQVAPTYAGGTTYAIKAVVLSAGVTYVSLQNANTGHTPASSPTWWEATVATTVTISAAGVAVHGPRGSVIITADGVAIDKGVLTSPTISVAGPGGATILIDSTNGLVVINGALSTASLNQGFLEVSIPVASFGGADGQYTATGFFITGANADGLNPGHGCTLASILGDNFGSVTLSDENGNPVVILQAGAFYVGQTGLTITNGGQLRTGPGSLVAVYDGIDTVGKGVPPIYAIVALTGQTGVIGATNILVGGVMAPAGLYRLTCRLPISAVGTAGSIELRITSNDGVSRTQLVLSVLSTSTANMSFTAMPVRTDGSAHIQYSITFNGITGSPHYGLDIAMERLA